MIFGSESPRLHATIGNAAQACVARLLKPLVRMLLRYGVPCGAFIDIAKRIYVDVAMESVLTGITTVFASEIRA